MAEQLSGTIVVIIIAVGVQACIMLFIFAKRQIMRFALRNKRGPHTSVAQGAPKPLRREADRCLECTPYIRHEPHSVAGGSSATAVRGGRGGTDHARRSIALQLYHSLEREIAGFSGLSYTRLPGSSVRAFLVRCATGPLSGVDARDLDLLCDEYEHARHHYEEFGEDKLKNFSSRVDSLRVRLRENRALMPPSPIPYNKNGVNSGGNSHNAKSATRERRKNKSKSGDSVAVSFDSRGNSRARLLQPLPQTDVVVSTHEEEGRLLTAV